MSLNNENKLLYILQNKIGECNRCNLSKNRTNIVFYRGNPDSKIMIVGEAPGENEDLKGIPFCGKSGDLLDKLLIHCDIQDYYITNVVKCRPPKNRNPEPNEISKCSPFIRLQIMTLKPKIIIALGRVASNFLTNSTESMKNLRQNNPNQYVCKKTNIECPVICSYHPSYILRNDGCFDPKRDINKLVINDFKSSLQYI